MAKVLCGISECLGRPVGISPVMLCSVFADSVPVCSLHLELIYAAEDRIVESRFGRDSEKKKNLTDSVLFSID